MCFISSVCPNFSVGMYVAAQCLKLEFDVNNNSRQYDSHVWLEPVECIVENSGQVVTKPLDVAELREGDQVNITWGGKRKKL